MGQQQQQQEGPVAMEEDVKMETTAEDSRHLQHGFSPDYLKLYYGRLFPFAEMYKWLSYGNDGKHPGCDPSFIARREFSFTLEHDIYLRYLSFHDASEMEATIRAKCPHKIDIGAVYNVEPAKRTAYSGAGSDRVFSPVERELVFDIDMTDYDDIRNCCSGADICLKCWPLMTIAIKVVDTALRGFFLSFISQAFLDSCQHCEDTLAI
jgi:DNA primase small subunit